VHEENIPQSPGLQIIESDLAYMPSSKELDTLAPMVWEAWLAKLHADGIVHPINFLSLKAISNGVVARANPSLNPYPMAKLQAAILNRVLEFGQSLVRANTTRQDGFFTTEYTVVKAHPGIVWVRKENWCGLSEMAFQLEWLEVGRKIRGDQKWTR
jgi:hypothetical protein